MYFYNDLTIFCGSFIDFLCPIMKTLKDHQIFYLYLPDVFVGGMELVTKLKADEKMTSDKDCKTALDEMEMLLKYCELYKCHDKVSVRIIYDRLCPPVNHSR